MNIIPSKQVIHYDEAGVLTIEDTGLTITAGGLTVTAGGLTVTADGLTVTAGGATITAGGLTVTAGGITVTAGNVVIPTATPASAAAAGTLGSIAWDGSYFYVCSATNTWLRVGIATW